MHIFEKNLGQFGLLFCLLLMVFHSANIEAKLELRYERKIPQLEQPWFFSHPKAVAAAPDGTMWVADSDNSRLLHIHANGSIISSIGSAQDNNPGNFYMPQGLAVAADGSVWVADTHNHRIQHLKASGEFIAMFGTEGMADGQYNYPDGIAVSPVDGSIWVADTGNHRVQHLSVAGAVLGTYGSYGSADGMFKSPSGLTVAPDGSVWVADTFNDRIQHLAANGTFMAKYGSSGSANGQFLAPEEVALAPNGDLWIVERANDRITHLSATGNFKAIIGSSGTLTGQFNAPWGIAAASDGSIWIADAFNNRLQSFDFNGDFKVELSNSGFGAGEFNYAYSIAVSPQDNTLWVTDTTFEKQYRIQHFEADGSISQIVNQGNASPTPFAAASVAIGKNGSIWVADTLNQRLQHYDSNHTLLSQVTSWNGGQFNYPEFIAVSLKDDSVWVTDTGTNHLVHFDSNGSFLSEIILPQGSLPQAIGIASDNSVWVTDSNNSIQHYSFNGTLLGKFGSYGSGPGQLNDPAGIAVSTIDDSLWVVDSGNSRIQHFKADGTYIEQFGSIGSGEGQFVEPIGIAIDSTGSLWVNDGFTNRIQKFKPVHNSDYSKAIIVAGGSTSNELWTATQLNSNYAYLALRAQGFNKNELKYFNANTQQDLDFNKQYDDISGISSKANLQDAVLNWTQSSTTDNIFLYLIDHGGDGSFRLSDTETLSVNELDGWLDKLEAALPTIKHITILIDASESGSFIRPFAGNLATLAGPKRRIIASAQASQNAYFLDQGNVSFSNYFWRGVFQGKDLHASFDQAYQGMSAYQSAEVDFNGNGKSNESDDFALMHEQYIGNGIAAKAAVPIFGNTQATPHQFTFSPNFRHYSSISLKIKSVEDILDAYAFVRTPDFDPGSASNTIINLPKIIFNFNFATERYVSHGYWDTNTEGKYTFNSGDYPFSKPGSYILNFYAQDTNYNTAEPKQLVVSVNNNKPRRAVIVEGYAANDALKASFRDNVQLAHEALVHQGYSEDNIYFLSNADLTGVDATSTAANLQFALTQWGISNNIDTTEDLTVYLIADHVQIDNQSGLLLSKINNSSNFESVTLNQLSQWLDQRQNTAGFNQDTGLIYSGVVTVIVDACNSGEIISTLNPNHKRRILISSTGNGAAHFTHHTLANGQQFSNLISFSRVFWQQVEHGANVSDAFTAAGDAVNLLAGVQTPQLDDNFNTIANDPGQLDNQGNTIVAKDGDITRKFSLGLGIIAPEDQPRILDHTPSGDNLNGQLNLDVEVAATNTIQDVWVIIKRPDYSPDCGAYDQLPKVHLTADPSKPGHWISNYNKLDVNGEYQLTFYAIDQNAEQSDPASATIVRKSANPVSFVGATAGLFEPDNSLQQANVILVNNVQAQTHALETIDDQDYLVFYGRKDKTYTIDLSQVGLDIDPGFEVYNRQGILQKALVDTGVNGEREIIDFRATTDDFYYLKVTNRGHSTGARNTYQVRVLIGNTPQIGVISGNIISQCDGSPVDFVRIQANNDFTYSYQGQYSLPLTPGTYQVSTGDDANLYDVQIRSMAVKDSDILKSYFAVTPRAGCPITSCPTGQLLLGNQCVGISCPFGQQLQGNQCVAISCPIGQQLQGNQCVAITCPTGQQLQGNQCVTSLKTCIAPQVVKDGTCVDPAVQSCPVNQILQNNLCVTPPPSAPLVNLNLNGPFQGDSQAPPTLTDSTIGGGANVSNVIIGQGTQVDPNAKLGEGVKFTDNSLIPANIDLTQTLGKTGNNNAPDLSKDIVPGNPSLLGQIQNITGFESLPINQNAQGDLQISVGTDIYGITPTKITQAPAGTASGLEFQDDGTVQLITASGRVLTLVASPADLINLKQSLENFLGLSFGQRDPNTGNFTVVTHSPPKKGKVAQERTFLFYSVRPDLSSSPATVAKQEGLFMVPSKDLPNVNSAYQVFTQDGQLRQQKMLPIPLDWPSIQVSLQQLGFSKVKLNPDGIFQADKGGLHYTAMVDYGVYAGDDPGSLRYLGSGDLNQDGIDDLWIIYPDGRSQQALLFPVNKIAVHRNREGRAQD